MARLLDMVDANTPLAGPSTNFPTPDTRNTYNVLDFDATTEENAEFERAMAEDFGTSGFSVEIEWAASSATSGNVVWGVALDRLVIDSTDMDSARTYATEKTVTDAAPANSGEFTRAVISFSNSEIDSIVAGDTYMLKVARVAADGSDTMAGDAELKRVRLIES